MRKTSNQKTDARIQSDVIDELKWDTRVEATAVGVEVTAGVVTLTGTVNSWGARFVASEAAHRVSGVRDVANDIQVKVPGSHERSDTDIARAVRSALEWNVLVPHERIRTTVSRGVVTLEGKVDYWSQYDDAAQAIRNLAGVRQVNNLISVEPTWPHVAPEAVRDVIASALERHAEHAAKQVQIAVTDDRVILSGEVPSWAERQAVEGAVRGTPGVRRVESTIRIHA